MTGPGLDVSGKLGISHISHLPTSGIPPIFFFPALSRACWTSGQIPSHTDHAGRLSSTSPTRTQHQSWLWSWQCRFNVITHLAPIFGILCDAGAAADLDLSRCGSLILHNRVLLVPLFRRFPTILCRMTTRSFLCHSNIQRPTPDHASSDISTHRVVSRHGWFKPCMAKSCPLKDIVVRAVRSTTSVHTLALKPTQSFHAPPDPNSSCTFSMHCTNLDVSL
jgi:hypothetical protein